jgi:hypothetical protein
MNEPTLGLGGRLFFLRYFLLAATATAATIFFIAVRGIFIVVVVIIIFIWSTFIPLCETYLGGEQRAWAEKEHT